MTQPKSQTLLVASNWTFSVLAGGTAPLHYQWQFNGTDLADATNLTPPVFWIPIWTNPVGGNWHYTNSVTETSRLQFYRVSTP